MPSPFPGMNPYLEQDDAWGDFHQALIPGIRDELTAQLRPNYVVKVEHRFAVDVERQAFLEIRDRASRELVTVIEVLSPSNKRTGPDREQYLAKRNQLLLSNVHLVEIDLLRVGPRLPVRDLPECDYFYLVSRVDARPEVELWPFLLGDPLPRVPIPVHAGREDASVDLKRLLDSIHDRAGYADYIYLTPPQPPLRDDQQRWADQFIPR